LAVGALVVPLALTACSSSSSSGGSGSGSKSATQCGSGAGVGKPTGGTLKIGFQGPLSGDNQQLGINARDGMKVAIEQANTSNALPYKLSLVESDDMGSPDQGPTAAQKLVDDQGVTAVVGPMFSGATKASEPVFCQNGMLSISPSATNPALTSLGFSQFVRVIAPDTVQGKAAADYVVKTLQA
jgi:branched-chain amino acid transport system substrate-binding protein